jgi:hypothetical protein
LGKIASAGMHGGASIPRFSLCLPRDVKPEDFGGGVIIELMLPAAELAGGRGTDEIRASTPCNASNQ